jgi:hypothetical protein
MRRETPNPALLRGEKKRLIFMVVCLVLVSGAMIASLYQGRRSAQNAEPHLIEDESIAAPAPVAIPPLDVARLDALVSDGAETDRVVLETEAADLLVEAARRYTPRHFESLKAPELDRETIQALEADAPSFRGKAFTARGKLDALRPRTGVVGQRQWLGTLELEDGSHVHFLALEIPEGAEDVGGTLRVDGLFLKNYLVEDEIAAGRWIGGPLLVAPRAIRSFPSLGTVTSLNATAFLDVEDADLSPEPGQSPRLVMDSPFDALWHLMAFARDMPADAIDWSEAPVLDQRLLDQLVEHPEEWRAQPVQIPISRLQDGRVKLAGENPARMERYTQGWIGNTTWRNVIRFRSPVLRPDLRIGDLVYGRGFFLHNFAYESAEHGLRVAPMFVLTELEHHVPRPSPALQRIPWAIAIVVAALTALFVFLSRRDSRQSSQLQEELVRRRRARRTKSPADAGSAAR